MFICHKCSGLLASAELEDTTGLYACCCMSGYVRDFQSEVPRSEALTAQVEATIEERELYLAQKRSRQCLEYCDRKLAKLGATVLHNAVYHLCMRAVPDGTRRRHPFDADDVEAYNIMDKLEKALVQLQR